MPELFFSRRDDAERAFARIDTDNDGLLSASQVCEAVPAAGAKAWSQRRIDFVMQLFERKDGKLDLEQFSRLLAYLERGASVHDELAEAWRRVAELEGGDALAESDAKAKVREDPLRVEALLAEAQKGVLPMAVTAELATATATATFNIKDKRDGLAQLVADAAAAKEKATYRVDKLKHERREKALSAQRDEAQGQLDRITAEAKPTNEKAMAALMPAVAQ